MEEEIEVPESAIVVPRQEQVREIIQKIVNGESHLSYSALKNFKESPADFIQYKLKEKKKTDAMLYGSMLHCLVLEPDDFYNRYFVLDDAAKKVEIGGAKPTATNAYKNWVAEMTSVAEGLGREVVKKEKFEIAESIAAGVLRNPASRKILDLCPEREVPREWEYGPYKWKGFIDGKGEGKTKKSKFDLKSCADANPKKFLYDLMKMSYYLQGSMYQQSDVEELGRDQDYYIIAVDMKGGISCHQLSPNLLERGRKEYAFLTEKFSECILRNSWDASYEFFAERWDGIYTADRPY